MLLAALLLGCALAVYLLIGVIAPKGTASWARRGYVASVALMCVLFAIWLVGTLRAVLAFFADTYRR